MSARADVDVRAEDVWVVKAALLPLANTLRGGLDLVAFDRRKAASLLRVDALGNVYGFCRRLLTVDFELGSKLACGACSRRGQSRPVLAKTRTIPGMWEGRISREVALAKIRVEAIRAAVFRATTERLPRRR